jgi:alpha-glucosidase
MVYVNHRTLEQQLDELLPLYKSWGIDGIKFGFVHTGSHRWTVWLHDAIKKAAEYQLMVNVHDNYRPTGYSRTYPNLMTMEGIHGNEEMPDATHNTVLPFTRFVAGRADYTICYYFREEFGKTKKHLKTTPAHQLALSVIYYSPLQWLFWYDLPDDYQGEPEIEFFEKVPTVWDKTRVVDGRIGEYVAVARRKGKDWYMGIITGNQQRALSVPLHFLEEDRQYLVSVYTDGGQEIRTRTHVKIERYHVDHQDFIDLDLKPGGGAAFHFKVMDQKDMKDAAEHPRSMDTDRIVHHRRSPLDHRSVRAALSVWPPFLP